MFNKKNTEIENPALVEAIDLAIAELKQHDPDTEKYAAIVTQIEKLHALKETPKKVEDKVSKDNLIAVAGNLLGIGMILGYERVHVVTSKALGFVIKSRV